MQYSAETVLTALVFALMLGSGSVWLMVVKRLRERRSPIPYQPHPVVPWSGLDLLFLVFAAILFLVLVGSMVLGGTNDPAESLSVDALAANCLSQLLWMVFAVMFLTAKTGAYLDDLGLDVRAISADARLGVTTFLAAVVPVFGVQLLFTAFFEMPSEHPLIKLVTQHGNVSLLVLTTIAVVFVAPLVEEFLFRVLLQGWLEKIWRESRELDPSEPAGWTPIVIVSAIFGLLHYGHGPDPIALFLLALFLGYAYQRTHRIVAPLVIHASINALTMLQLWLAFFAGE